MLCKCCTLEEEKALDDRVVRFLTCADDVANERIPFCGGVKRKYGQWSTLVRTQGTYHRFDIKTTPGKAKALSARKGFTFALELFHPPSLKSTSLCVFLCLYNSLFRALIH